MLHWQPKSAEFSVSLAGIEPGSFHKRVNLANHCTGPVQGPKIAHLDECEALKRFEAILIVHFPFIFDIKFYDSKRRQS